MKQDQFLTVLSRNEAEDRIREYIGLEALPDEEVPLENALGRVLARDVVAAMDVPAFHRSNVDGFAVIAADTYHADEEAPSCLALNSEQIAAGDVPQVEVRPGTATLIATGAVIPKGASAVVMVEYTEVRGGELAVFRPAGPGDGLSYAGSDLMQGETVIRSGQLLSARDTGTLAALGIAVVHCVRKPEIAILSTGNEIIAPGQAISEGKIFDSNSRIVADTVIENGARPRYLGIASDDEAQVEASMRKGLQSDMLILSGGTSKGGGDLNYKVLSRLGPPGILFHGVALKPGKPLCFALVHEKPVFILPGFPTSAIVTFRDLVLPVIRGMAGLPPKAKQVVPARQAIRYHSDRGRMEYCMVNLVKSDKGFRAYPWTKGSGAVTTFSQADGFLRIPANQEMVEEGQHVEIELIGDEIRVPDILSIGSHCVGLDALLSEIKQLGFAVKIINIGSTGGLEAARRGESDLAGVHLLDEESGEFNLPFLKPADSLVLVRGYTRQQGLLFRKEKPGERTLRNLVKAHLEGQPLVMVNRNRGSGTRMLTDQQLARYAKELGTSFTDLVKCLRGYEVEARSHNAVATSVATHKANWGIGIETVARDYGLDFSFLADEHFDFVIPRSKLNSPAVAHFLDLLQSPRTADRLRSMGFTVPDTMGSLLRE